MNDLPMLSTGVAACLTAPDNAVEEVKQAVREKDGYVSHQPWGHGVARGLEHYAVGLDGFAAAIDEERRHVALGHGMFKAVRGDYGSGKTFFARWMQRRAQHDGFATAEVQISETFDCQVVAQSETIVGGPGQRTIAEVRNAIIFTKRA